MKDFAGERGMSMGIPWPGGFLASWLHCIGTLTSSNFSFSSSFLNEAESSEMYYVRIGNSICLVWGLLFLGRMFLQAQVINEEKPQQKTSLPISLTATNLSPNSPFFSSSSSLMIPPPPSHLYSSLYSSLHPSSQKSPSSSTLCES